MNASDNGIPPKEAGETRVVYLGGDQLHNYMGQRQSIQQVLGGTGWRLLFTQDARHVTSEVVAGTDLLMIRAGAAPSRDGAPTPFTRAPWRATGT